MSCAACHHRFSAQEILRVINPLSFSCPQCGVRLTLDKVGCALLAIVCVVAALAGKYVAGLYLAGSLSLFQSLLVLVLIVVAFVPVQLLYNRFARYKPK